MKKVHSYEITEHGLGMGAHRMFFALRAHARIFLECKKRNRFSGFYWKKAFLYLTTVVLLLATSSVFPDESWTPTSNSIRILASIFSGRTNPFFYEIDPNTIAIIKNMITAIKRNQSPHPLVIPSRPGYTGTCIDILDSIHVGPYIALIYDGLFYEDSTKTTYIDSNRSLERYLLCLLSKSRIVDTLMWFEPLSTAVPDSLFSGCTTTSTITPSFRSLNAATPSMTHGRFDLLGRKILVVPFSIINKNHPATENAIKQTGLKGKADNSATGLLIIKKE
jgi:hypothetical protein